MQAQPNQSSTFQTQAGQPGLADPTSGSLDSTAENAAGATEPPSRVADHAYPNVQETTPQQGGATDPSGGGMAGADVNDAEKIPFKDQVHGYAKKIAGTVFQNDKEKEFGEAKLQGKV